MEPINQIQYNTTKETSLLIVLLRLLLIPIPLILLALTFLGGFACAFGGVNNPYCKFNLPIAYLANAVSIVAIGSIISAGRKKRVHWSSYAVLVGSVLLSLGLVLGPDIIRSF